MKLPFLTVFHSVSHGFPMGFPANKVGFPMVFAMASPTEALNSRQWRLVSRAVAARAWHEEELGVMMLMITLWWTNIAMENGHL